MSSNHAAGFDVFLFINKLTVEIYLKPVTTSLIEQTPTGRFRRFCLFVGQLCSCCLADDFPASPLLPLLSLLVLVSSSIISSESGSVFSLHLIRWQFFLKRNLAGDQQVSASRLAAEATPRGVGAHRSVEGRSCFLLHTKYYDMLRTKRWLRVFLFF